jgi:hypothetical protein
MTLVEQRFDIFWQLYPRKAGKKTAKKAWDGLSPDDSLFSTMQPEGPVPIHMTYLFCLLV